MTSSPRTWHSAWHFLIDQHTELDEVPICLHSPQGYDWLLPALLLHLQMCVCANCQGRGSDVIRFNLICMYRPLYTMKGKIYFITAASIHVCFCLSVCLGILRWLTASVCLAVWNTSLLCALSNIRDACPVPNSFFSSFVSFTNSNIHRAHQSASSSHVGFPVDTFKELKCSCLSLRCLSQEVSVKSWHRDKQYGSLQRLEHINKLKLLLHRVFFFFSSKS